MILGLIPIHKIEGEQFMSLSYKTILNLFLCVLASYHNISNALSQTKLDNGKEKAVTAECSVGLYQRHSDNFVALTKRSSGYGYTFKNNTHGAVGAKELVTSCGDKTIALSNGEIWSLVDIEIKNSKFVSEGVSLSGRLMQPKHMGKGTPLVVFAHGSETTGWIDRARDPYLLLARGVSVFVFDKRGTGLSEGQYTQNFPLLSKDLVAASKEAKRLSGGKYGRFGLIALSQGGWIAPMAASDTNADFISIGYGLVADLREEDAAQVVNDLLDAGFGEEELAKAKQLTDATALIASSGYKQGLQALDKARDAYKNESWYVYVKGGYTGTFLQKTTEDLAKNGIPFYDRLNIDWSLNPMDVMKSVNVPQLWIIAAEDREAPVDLTMKRLNSLKRMGKPIDIYMFPDTDHGMWEFTVDDSGKRHYTKVTEGYYDLLADWAFGRKLSQYGKARQKTDI